MISGYPSSMQSTVANMSALRPHVGWLLNCCIRLQLRRTVLLMQAISIHWLVSPSRYGCVVRDVRKPSDSYMQMYTRECPFSGHSDLHVERMVLRGDRPERPTNGSGQPMGDPLWRLLESCWHASASQRPSISEVVDRLKLIAVDTRSRSR